MDAAPRGNLTPCRSAVRLRGGVGFFAVALGLTMLAMQPGVPAGYRLALVVPFFLAALGVFQGLYGTCLKRAMRGEREDPSGPEPILNPAVRATMHSEMRRILVRAGAVALACTALVYALP